MRSGDRQKGSIEGQRARLREFFGSRDEIVLAYLFGSQVEGYVGPMSDYDVGVLTRPDTPYDLRYELSHELSKLLDARRVDVVMLRRAPIELAYNIIATGELLYELDVATRVEFEANVMTRYFDYLPVLRQQRRDIITEATS